MKRDRAGCRYDVLVCAECCVPVVAAARGERALRHAQCVRVLQLRCVLHPARRLLLGLLLGLQPRRYASADKRGARKNGRGK